MDDMIFRLTEVGVERDDGTVTRLNNIEIAARVKMPNVFGWGRVPVRAARR